MPRLAPDKEQRPYCRFFLKAPSPRRDNKVPTPHQQRAFRAAWKHLLQIFLCQIEARGEKIEKLPDFGKYTSLGQ